MMKSLLITTVSAVALLCPALLQARSQEPVKAPMRLMAGPHESDNLPDNQAWYGYFKGTETISAFGVGFPKEQYVNNAIFVDGNDPVCKGKAIKGMRFMIQGAGDIDNISAWLSPSLNVPVDDDLIVSVAVDESTIVDGGVWTVVTLPEPYVIPEEGVYAGYSVHSNGTKHESQMVGYTTNDGIGPDGALYNYETGFMSGWQWYGDRMGKLVYQVLLEGDFDKDAVAVADFGNHFAVKGGSISIPLSLTNYGTAGVESIDYVVYTGGKPGEERHIALDSRFGVFGGTFEAVIPLDADEATALASKKVEITRVNGNPNAISADMATGEGSLVTLAQESRRIAVAETYTGTWCGWCPRAFVGNEKLKGIYGDRFIFIEAHVGMMDDVDPMSIAPYEELKDDRRGYPASVFSRECSGDPYTGLTRKAVFLAGEAVEGILNGVAEAEISVTAEWANVARTRIKAISEITFQYDTDNAHYAVAYVVKANGLRGEGPEWMQTNNFPYYAEEEEYAPGTDLYNDFRFWLEQPGELVPDMVYDDVAVAAYGLASGLPGSVTAPISTGVSQTFQYVMSVGNNQLIGSDASLSVVALLIDTESGRIVNAAECSMDTPDSVEGIVDGDIRETARFNLMGQPLAAPQQGVNVVVYSNGEVRKVIVK